MKAEYAKPFETLIDDERSIARRRVCNEFQVGLLGSTQAPTHLEEKFISVNENLSGTNFFLFTRQPNSIQWLLLHVFLW